MPAFRSMVRELAVIEHKGHITVVCRDYNLPIKVQVVVGDKSFMWKFTKRELSTGSRVADVVALRANFAGCAIATHSKDIRDSLGGVKVVVPRG